MDSIHPVKEVSKDSFLTRKIKVAWTKIEKEMCDVICSALVNREDAYPVKVLDLLDNQLTPAQVQKIASCLESSPVSDIYIAYNNVGADGCRGLATVINASTNLEYLDLRGNNLTPSDARTLFKAVSRSVSLQNLGLGHNKLGPDGMSLLAKALERNTYLTALDISMNEIGAAGAACIASVLSNASSNLRSINLYGNHLGATGLKLIFNALQQNKELRVLNVANNNGTDAMCVELGDVLDVNTTLEDLDIRWNSISGAGIKDLAKHGLQKNLSIRKLLVSGNPIGPVGAEELSKALNKRGRGCFQYLDVSSCELESVGGIRMSSFIMCSLTLKEIYLSDNHLDDDAALSIARAAAESISLSTIDLSLNDIGESGANALVDAAHLNAHLVSMVLHGNSINRVVQKKIDNLMEERISSNRVEKAVTVLSSPI